MDETNQGSVNTEIARIEQLMQEYKEKMLPEPRMPIVLLLYLRLNFCGVNYKIIPILYIQK